MLAPLSCSLGARFFLSMSERAHLFEALGIEWVRYKGLGMTIGFPSSSTKNAAAMKVAAASAFRVPVSSIPPAPKYHGIMIVVAFHFSPSWS